MIYCKVGDLAIIVNDDLLQENLGVIVRIISSAGLKGWYPYSKRLKRWSKRSKTLFTWNVVALSSLGICYNSTEDDSLYYLLSGRWPDADLRPLTALEEADAVTRQEEIYAE